MRAILHIPSHQKYGGTLALSIKQKVLFTFSVRKSHFSVHAAATFVKCRRCLWKIYVLTGSFFYVASFTQALRFLTDVHACLYHLIIN